MVSLRFKENCGPVRMVQIQETFNLQLCFQSGEFQSGKWFIVAEGDCLGVTLLEPFARD